MVRKTAKDLQQQIAELTEALQRERADSVNLRRRTEEERQQLAELYKAMVVSQLLPAIDNFERAISHKPKASRLEASGSGLKAWEDWAQGVLGVKAQLDRSLSELGVERIKTLGEHFDPHLHEAVHLEDSQGKHEVISEEIQAGYKLGNEVLRPAQVKVKKG